MNEEQEYFNLFQVYELSGAQFPFWAKAWEPTNHTLFVKGWVKPDYGLKGHSKTIYGFVDPSTKGFFIADMYDKRKQILKAKNHLLEPALASCWQQA